MKKITVKQAPDAEVPTEVLASSIVTISEGIRKLRAGRLNDRALFLLIQHAAPTDARYQRIGIGEIKSVIDGMESLASTYLRKPQKP